MLRVIDSLKRSSCTWTIFKSRDPFTYYGRTSLRLTRAESMWQTQSKVTVENRLSEIYKI